MSCRHIVTETTCQFSRHVQLFRPFIIFTISADTFDFLPFTNWIRKWPLATSHKQMNGEGQQLETCNNEPHSGHNVRCPHSTFRPHNKKNTWINNCLDTTSIHFHRTFVQSLVNVNFLAESLIVLFLQIELSGIPWIFLCFVVCLSYYWSFCGTNWEDYVRPKISLRVFLPAQSAAELRHLLHIARLCCDTPTLVCGGNLAVLLCDRPTILSRSRSCRLYAWRQPMTKIIVQIS